MIIQFARIFSSSIYHDSPQWVAVVKMMEQWDDDMCLANLDAIKENSGYVSLTPVVYKELSNIMTAKDAAGFLSLFDALKYPVFSALLITVYLQDVGFVESLVKQIPNQDVIRPKMTMALLRDRWIEVTAKQVLCQDVAMGEPVEKGITKPIEGEQKSTLLAELNGMLQVLGAEEMFHWAIELKAHKTFTDKVQYQTDPETVAYNRLRLFVLDELPRLVVLNDMKIDGSHLPYLLYMLSGYVYHEPTNTARMDELLKAVFSYLGSNMMPPCSNEELYKLLAPAAEAYALCRSQDSKGIIALLDDRRVNVEGWRMESHHKILVDDDVDTDMLTWPKHYMSREQQEIIAYRLAWELLGIDKHFVNDTYKESYFDAIASRLFTKMRSLDGNHFRVDSYGIHGVVALAYEQTVKAISSKVEWFVSSLFESIDGLYDIFMFLYDCKIQLAHCHKQALKKRYDEDWAGERKVYEILGLYKKQQLDAVEAELKKLIVV